MRQAFPSEGESAAEQQVQGRSLGKVVGYPSLVVSLVGVDGLNELEGNAVRIMEVDPTPPGKHAVIDDVDVGEELDPFRLQLRAPDPALRTTGSAR
jgi:hypothetical protein